MARSGSKGLPGKHFFDFSGKPLLLQTIRQALGTSFKVLFASDSTSYLSMYASLVDYVYVRSDENANDKAPKLNAIRESVEGIEKIYRTKFDCIIDLDATNPCRTVKDIINCYRIFKKTNCDSVISVVKSRKNPYFNQIEKDPVYFFKVIDDTHSVLRKNSVDVCSYEINGFEKCKCKGTVTDRQSCPKTYDINANIYVYKRDFLFSNTLSPIGSDTKIYVMPDYAAFDIDTKNDFDIAEMMFEKYYKGV